MKPTTIYLSQETEAHLQKLALQTGQQPHELIQEAISNYLALRTQKLPKSVGMGASNMSDLASRSEELLWKEES
ncbi:ribbon-helix-helix protein, CopG family [Aetokthonos hydrillicola Thurmond2011]|jgi:predicted transcriptional regulator|uniref:Ribbon-helix-helix protein, CopG family n=1 Tax=Aetokthonos hydrillicola Thurmond2011 TaxID=2712845 RepID=A0AAP5MCQ1_9CYAN|nr:CopG family transcriptional regulator [Aetokthonos hydrillicola]MBO3459154.1 ribbon-helix-helix protein, CopG family [Aetokthonos hydrillicola CCALA 1050]MBW4584113.1 ribbon-helix-helix domain-containing protein [Aetokthonos hydrillicola CCALA 1050]MDR9898354.1 ribbon-helix-helix protein, CopG family [Aetokthonos hydrillicola Thurmond2011]